MPRNAQRKASKSLVYYVNSKWELLSSLLILMQVAPQVLPDIAATTLLPG